ncbi:MAG: hypothetical protein Q8O45_06310 [Desulfurivibrionaceae bacterium]|nr:hypothetical protein [Desulfurivibrionaceae bacterium]
MTLGFNLGQMRCLFQVSLGQIYQFPGPFQPGQLACLMLGHGLLCPPLGPRQPSAARAKPGQAMVLTDLSVKIGLPSPHCIYVSSILVAFFRPCRLGCRCGGPAWVEYVESLSRLRDHVIMNMPVRFVCVFHN